MTAYDEIEKYINTLAVKHAITAVGEKSIDSIMMKIVLAFLSVILAVNGKESSRRSIISSL